MNEAPPLLAYIARDKALEQVLASNQSWADLALIQLKEICKRPTSWMEANGFANGESGVTGEDIRRMLTPHVGRPDHPNAYGALVKRAISLGLLVPTDRYRSMTEVRSHARRTRVYDLMRLQ